MKVILKLIGFCLSYVHACINPVIYSFTLSSFQQSLVNTFGLHKLNYVLRRCRLRNLKTRRTSISTLLSRRRKSKSGEGTVDAPLSTENFLTGERYIIDNVELDEMGSYVASECGQHKCTEPLCA